MFVWEAHAEPALPILRFKMREFRADGEFPFQSKGGERLIDNQRSPGLLLGAPREKGDKRGGDCESRYSRRGKGAKRNALVISSFP